MSDVTVTPPEDTGTIEVKAAKFIRRAIYCAMVNAEKETQQDTLQLRQAYVMARELTKVIEELQK